MCSMPACAACICAMRVCAVHACSVPEGVQHTSVCSVHLCNARVRTEHAWATCPICREPTPPSLPAPPCPARGRPAQPPSGAFASSSPPSPNSLGGGCSCPGSGCGTEHPALPGPLRRLPALRSRGAEPPPPGDGTRWPRGRALPRPGTPALGSRKPPGHCGPGAPARPGPAVAGPGIRGSPAPAAASRPPPGAAALRGGSDTPAPGAGKRRGSKRGGAGAGVPPSGHSSLPSPCKQGASGRREQTAEV